MSSTDAVALSLIVTVISELLYYRRARQFAVEGERVSAHARAERRLAAATVYMRAMLFVTVLGKILVHLGWMPADLKAVFPAFALPLLVAVVHYLKALWDVKRGREAKPN